MEKLSWREPTGQHSENSWETIANPVLNSYTKTRNHRKTLRITQKTTIYWNQNNSNYQNTSYVGARFLHLAWQGAVRQLYHWSGAFQTWTATSSLIESHVAIGTIQQTQPTCFEYIDKIVGIRLDQPSYWDSWKLVGRLWRYHTKVE